MENKFFGKVMMPAAHKNNSSWKIIGFLQRIMLSWLSHIHGFNYRLETNIQPLIAAILYHCIFKELTFHNIFMRHVLYIILCVTYDPHCFQQLKINGDNVLELVKSASFTAEMILLGFKSYFFLQSLKVPDLVDYVSPTLDFAQIISLLTRRWLNIEWVRWLSNYIGTLAPIKGFSKHFS